MDCRRGLTCLGHTTLVCGYTTDTPPRFRPGNNCSRPARAFSEAKLPPRKIGTSSFPCELSLWGREESVTVLLRMVCKSSIYKYSTMLSTCQIRQNML